MPPVASRKETKMLIYIDGDNTHGTRTTGAEALTKSDQIHVFYSSADKYYRRPENREELEHRSGAPVKFHLVQQGDNAVDFAIAMDAAVKAKAREKQAIILISSDKHFEVFGKQLQQRFPLCDVYVETSMIDALVRHGFSGDCGLDVLKLYFEQAFGEEAGREIYEQIEQLFSEKIRAERTPLAVRLMKRFMK